MVQQRENAGGKRLRAVGLQKVRAGCERKSFGADRGGDERLSHREGFENLDARTTSDPERHHRHGRPLHMRPHIIDRAGDGHVGGSRGLAQPW